MASPSWCKETDGKINYTKLCRLLVDGGTQAVRSVFDGIHPPSSLKAILNANKKTLQKLKKPKGKVLNDDQWNKLYPASGSDPKSEDFDITLLFVLIRNICGLTPPATGWDALPPGTDTSQEAYLARIKYYRNNTVAHKPNTEINDVDFEQHWQDISSALLSLGLSQDDIDDLKSDPLGKKDYNQLLHDWYMSDEDIKTQLEDVKSKAEDIKSDTAEIKEKLDDIKNVCSEAKEKDQAVNKLAISDFGPEISTKCKSFHPNTRQWILDQVKSHVDSDQPDSCIMLITAGPGMGKSTIAAKICQTYKDLGCLAGCHFFQFSNSTRNNPRLMMQSIARQMCDTVPGYREALEGKLQTDLGKNISEMNCEELITILLEEPLCKVQQTDSNFVVVLDALDECSHDSKDELLKALRQKLSFFPSWLRFILTSRPSTNTSALGSVVAVEIIAEDQSNIIDLGLFLMFELKALYPHYNNDDRVEDLVKELVYTTKGLFLVAFFVIDCLKRENVTSPEKVLETFPNGISSVYENYFSRLKDVMVPYISEEERFYKMLEAVVATNNPLPMNMFYNILCLKSERDVPRQERKARKDALNALHWLFPVEEDYVTVFHKSIVDWLTREGHDFSVRVEDGKEVLASQCNDVLSDIGNGKKDLDKPLDLTDSEKYCLRFLCQLVQKRSLIVKADKYGFFSNIYILTALKIEDDVFMLRQGDGLISSFLLDILLCMHRCFCKSDYIEFHEPSCHIRSAPSFGCYLAFVLQAAHAMGVSEGTTPNPLDALMNNVFPYFDEQVLLRAPGILALKERAMKPFSLRYIFKRKEGFTLALPCISCFDSLSTTVYMFHVDGSLVGSKTFLDVRLIATSPNINFIAVSKVQGNEIEILDVTTLEVVSQYEFPHDAIETCHVFGDEQGWFIVIKGRHDNKVCVMEGLTGRVRNIITVDEGSTVVDVSCQGHIVVTRTWNGEEAADKRGNPFNNKREVELMQWCTEKYPHLPMPNPLTPLEYSQMYINTYRELFLYHFDNAQEFIPIYPLAKQACDCPTSYAGPDIKVDEAVQLSEDGRLLAYHYKDSIFIVNTSDGSLFKRWPISDRNSSWGSHLGILFVSETYLVTIDLNFMSVINVRTNQIEHRIYLPHPVTPNGKQYLLFPEEDGKSFTLISNHSESYFHEVSSLVFQNLNLDGLR